MPTQTHLEPEHALKLIEESINHIIDVHADPKPLINTHRRIHILHFAQKQDIPL